MKIRGAKIVLECLLEQGVDTVFGYPGGTILNIYDELELGGYNKKIRHILTAHEQGAAHAADGYARSTGKVGVCFATSGPGATNLTTGIATAHMDSAPVVFNNSYNAADTSATLEGTKVLTGRELKDGEFSFIVTDKDGNVVSTGENEADGTITFKPITYTEAGTYVYTIAEVNSGMAGVTYDTTTYTATVTVVDNGEGQLEASVSYSGTVTFRNSYEPDQVSVTLEGTKTLTGTAADGLTEAEKAEQAELRRRYVANIKASLMADLDNTYIMDEKGNKTKLGKKNQA